jgi:acetate---CoA ligase (ADP-forming)
MPDIGRMLWPKSVAVIGASSDTRSLRGRILEVMKGHSYEGRIYPVNRRETEVQGLLTYLSIADLPEPADLAVLIIPARFVPEELERCGQAGVKAAIILSSGFAEEPGGTGARLQDEIRATAARHDMAVSGPNSEGFANTAAALCPTFSPAMNAGPMPLLPGHARGQVAVISQSGGMGYAFFDHGRPKGLSFRYIVTTGNEACLETFDFVDYMLDEGKTDVFLLLLEDVKAVATFERVAAKALHAGKPLVIGKLGQSDAGSRAVAAHTRANAGSQAEYRALFGRYGVVEGRDIEDMLDIASGFIAFGSRLPAGNRVGICTSSGGGGAWAADACTSAGLEVPLLDAQTRKRIDIYLPSYGTSQNPVDVTAQAIHERGYAEFARLVASSPEVDGVVVVITGRQPRFLLEDRDPLVTLARESTKPIFMWSYTRPADVCVALLGEAGYPLFTNIHNCARAMRAMADYRAARERFREGEQTTKGKSDGFVQ